MSGAQTESFSDVILGMIDSRISQLNTSMPGLIVSYDPATALAVVQPALKIKFRASGEIVALPIIENVPVLWPRGNSSVIEMDLEKDDPVTLIFSQRSIDLWLTSGGLTDPKDPRKHHLSDAFCFPGGYPKSKPQSAVKNKITMKKDGSIISMNEKVTTTLSADGGFSIKNAGGQFAFSKDGKFTTKGNGDSLDFFTQLLKVMDIFMEESKVATSLGLQPFIPAPTYATERAKLDEFLG